MCENSVWCLHVCLSCWWWLSVLLVAFVTDPTRASEDSTVGWFYISKLISTVLQHHGYRVQTQTWVGKHFCGLRDHGGGWLNGQAGLGPLGWAIASHSTVLGGVWRTTELAVVRVRGSEGAGPFPGRGRPEGSRGDPSNRPGGSPRLSTSESVTLQKRKNPLIFYYTFLEIEGKRK
jgi:hypothetical protein